MLDKPITPRAILYAVLIVVFFPFSLVFVFPRTALALCFGALLILMMKPMDTTTSVASRPAAMETMK